MSSSAKSKSLGKRASQSTSMWDFGEDEVPCLSRNKYHGAEGTQQKDSQVFPHGYTHFAMHNLFQHSESAAMPDEPCDNHNQSSEAA